MWINAEPECKTITDKMRQRTAREAPEHFLLSIKLKSKNLSHKEWANQQFHQTHLFENESIHFQVTVLSNA